MYRDLGDRYGVAYVLACLGDTRQAGGDPGAARPAWQQALGILLDLGHPDADGIHAKLEGGAR